MEFIILRVWNQHFIFKNFNGKNKEWTSDGVLMRETEYMNGVRHGKDMGFWSDTNIKMFYQTYENGILHGKNIRWTRDEKIEFEFYYVNDKIEGSITLAKN